MPARSSAWASSSAPAPRGAADEGGGLCRHRFLPGRVEDPGGNPDPYIDIVDVWLEILTSTNIDQCNPEAPMARVQLALNVSNLDDAVAFYSKLFGTEPAKRKPGYANFAIADPPLKLVLIEGDGGGTLNHLGVETESRKRSTAAEARLADDGLETTGVDDTICCYAAKTETWVNDPDGAPWEWYVKTGDTEQMTNRILTDGETATCCAPTTASATRRRRPAPGLIRRTATTTSMPSACSTSST